MVLSPVYHRTQSSGRRALSPVPTLAPGASNGLVDTAATSCSLSLMCPDHCDGGHSPRTPAAIKLNLYILYLLQHIESLIVGQLGPDSGG